MIVKRGIQSNTSIALFVEFNLSRDSVLVNSPLPIMLVIKVFPNTKPTIKNTRTIIMVNSSVIIALLFISVTYLILYYNIKLSIYINVSIVL